MAEADTQSHVASYLSAERSPRTSPIPRLSKPGTFSTMTNRGRSSPMRRPYSDHRPDRAPSRPARFPAWLMSWHGNPPQMTSTPIPSLERASAVRVLTSSYRGTSGQCFASTRRQNESISQKATVSNPPVRSKPKLKPPIPEKRSRTRSINLEPQAQTSTQQPQTPKAIRSPTCSLVLADLR